MFHFRETRILQMPRQHNVTNNAVPPQAYGREAHSHLKCYARFFRNDQYRTAAPDQFGELPEQCDCVRTFARKMLPQRVASTEVGLIAVRKRSCAFRALPQRGSTHREV